MDMCFDAKQINVLGLKKAVDCEIAIAEIKFCVDRIRRQLRDELGDAKWIQAANFAIEELEHKGRLVALKMADISSRPKFPDYVLAALSFKNAAGIVLDEKSLEKIRAQMSITKGQEKEEREQ